MSKQLQKYLHTRAITSPWQLEGSTRTNISAAIVIPALAEAESLPATLASLATNPAEYLKQTLIVVVVNNRVDASNGQLADNRKTLNWLQSNPHPQLNLTWVDASAADLELPAKEGVGLARKIGFDLVLSHLGGVKQALLASLDADTLVDGNYLPAIFTHFRQSDCGGAILPFRHQSAIDPQQELAIRRYELYLRSYLFGLQRAGSPYAFHSIGSAFACRAEGYVKAGGMNRRLAAEDFYFLQHLAKTDGVEMLSGTLIQPSARFSDRVPFGTGKTVQAQVEDERMSFGFISAGEFQILQDWLLLVGNNWDVSGEDLSLQATKISPVLRHFLDALNFVEVWEKLQKNHGSEQPRLIAFHRWFDGLRTRQLLARLAADRAEDGQQVELVSNLLAWGGYPGYGDPIAQLDLLESLQGVK